MNVLKHHAAISCVDGGSVNENGGFVNSFCVTSITSTLAKVALNVLISEFHLMRLMQCTLLMIGRFWFLMIFVALIN